MAASASTTESSAPRRLTAEDHHVQDALELFAVAHLQYLAERSGVAKGIEYAELHQQYVDALAVNGHTPDSVHQVKRHATYLKNAELGTEDLLNRLVAQHPGSKFSFSWTGKEGRLQRRKGDLDIVVEHPEDGSFTYQVSLKNYEKSPARIQVQSGTFQSFALGFLFESPGVGTYRCPVDESSCHSSSKKFLQWRDNALRRNGHGGLIKTFHALDKLQKDMRERFLSEEFRFYDKEKIAAEQKRIGLEGARLLHSILTSLPAEQVRQKVLKNIGFSGDEDLLVVGGGKIADTLTDPEFGALIKRVRAADLSVSRHHQGLALDFCDDDGIALSVKVPCTVNTNGAWWRDGDPFSGTKQHPKEGVELAWGQLRPKKSREIATSINTYVDLAATGVIRDLPGVATGVIRDLAGAAKPKPFKGFDVILTNPPFQDRTKRKRTPHKLWIDFTEKAFERWLRRGGLLLQVSPASFQSPSSRVLKLMRTYYTKLINFDVSHHFPGVGSSFAYYAIRNTTPKAVRPTKVVTNGQAQKIVLGEDLAWLPTDLTATGLSIHRKVMFSDRDRLDVRHDYVTCHNIRLGDTLSKEKTEKHIHPVFHTNAQTWYTSTIQDWATKPKVMWTRSGYTKPFFDNGTLGGTDMVYYVVTESEEAGRNLQHNLTLPLFAYIFSTAKWSGFGNELVFASLPSLPTDRRLTQEEICDLFGLTRQERDHVANYLG